MTDTTENLDLAQRIAAALALTTEPRASADGILRENSKVIGAVPPHLRHLHNLYEDVINETRAVERNLKTKLGQVEALRAIFFDSLRSHVYEPEDATGLTLLENWDVVANFKPDEEGLDLGDLLLAAIAGGRRR